MDNSTLLKELESLKKRVSELESQKKDNKPIFGRSYSQIGDSNSDVLIKTKGQVKIQWGQKFIDLIKDGKINVESDLIYKSKSVGTKNGFYILEDGSVWLVMSNIAPIPIVSNEIGSTYVSFIGQQESTPDNKYQALTNIGFLYPNLLSINEQSLKNGIIYVESEQKLYIVTDGQLSEYKITLPNPFTEQFIIAKNDNSKGALFIKGSGINNSIAFDGLWIYNDEIQIKYESELPILFNILGKDILKLSSNKCVFNTTIETDSIQSRNVSQNNGYRLYIMNGKSILEVDKVIERDSSTLFPILYPEYWLWCNNIIVDCIEQETDESSDIQELQLEFSQVHNFLAGDTIIVYSQEEGDYDEDTEDYRVNYIQNKLSVTQIVNTKAVLVTSSDSVDDTTQLVGKYAFLIRRDGSSPLRIKDNTLDVIEYPEETIKARFGDITSLQLEVTNGTASNKNIEVCEDAQIYGQQAVFGLAKYLSNTIISDDDDSSTLATTEWVNKKVQSQFRAGYYYAKNFVNNIPESPEYIGTTSQDFEVSEEFPYLLYTNNGITWNVVNKYISPVANRIYVLSTNVSNNTIPHTGELIRWPSGFLCYYNNGQSVATPFGKSNYVPVVYTYEDQITQIPQLTVLLQEAELGQVPQKSGYFYLWSILETDDKSNPSNWTIENSGSIPVSIVYEDTSDWGNSSLRPGYVIWEVDDNDIIIGTPPSTKFIGGFGTEENWQDPIWRKSFLEAILGSTLTANIHNYDTTFGWRFNYSGILKSIGYAGYWCSRIEELRDPSSDDENDPEFLPTSIIGDVYGQVMDQGKLIQFMFINVRIGKVLPYRYGNSNLAVGDKLAQGSVQLFEASYEKCFYKRISDYQEFTL